LTGLVLMVGSCTKTVGVDSALPSRGMGYCDSDLKRGPNTHEPRLWML